ncbi:MAG TPA: HDOD domain-containing protein [Desulfobulbus sp.]|nr:HDOD domain-containing protein [Desulfobulbus sp.]
MEKKTVLFVDDEPNILSGLQRMLRPMRRTMNFKFAEDGPAALEIMAAGNVDVVVSDMRMPGMDGATLLATIQEKYPHAIRIMLTGQADNEAILRTVSVVHQFLAKPADPELLKQVINRATALQDLMADERLKEVISSIGSLPSLPETYARLQQVLRDPDGSLADAAAVIEQDLAMSAKVLQLVNSAFFGLFRHIESPSRAVNLLGLDTIKALVLGVGVFEDMKVVSSNTFNVKALWSHSMATAAFAKQIALRETADREMIDHAFVAGLLHDVGKLLLFSRMPDEYEQAVRTATETSCSLLEAEQGIFGLSHGDVGGYLIGLWGLPGPVVESITFHHRLHRYPHPGFGPALIVHVADYISYRLDPDQCIGEKPCLDEEILDQAGMLDRIDEWSDLCRELQEKNSDG